MNKNLIIGGVVVIAIIAAGNLMHYGKDIPLVGTGAEGFGA